MDGVSGWHGPSIRSHGWQPARHDGSHACTRTRTHARTRAPHEGEAAAGAARGGGAVAGRESKGHREGLQKGDGGRSAAA